MKIDTLELENFKAIRGHRKYELPSGIIGIVGGNGQGKSTLTTAISWCLYGPLVFGKRVSSADAVNWHEKEAMVGIDFTVGGESYELIRNQDSSGSKAQLRGPVNVDGPDAVTKAVTDILGIDRVGFLASTFSRQKDLEGLASLSGSDRTTTILRLRGLDRITKGIDTISDVARDAKKTLAVLRGYDQNPKSLSEYDDEISNLKVSIKGLNKDISDLQKAELLAFEEVQELVESQESLASKREAYFTYLSKAAACHHELQRAEEALEKAESKAAEPLPVKPRPPSVTANAKKFKSLAQSQAQDREYVRGLMDTLAAKEFCPTCLRAYDNAEELEKAKSKARGEKVKADKRIQKREVELEAMQQVIKAEEEYVSKLDRWESVELKAWQDNQDALTVCKKAVEAAKLAASRIVPVPDVSDEYDTLAIRIRIASERLTDTRTGLVTQKGQRSLLQERLSSLEVDRDRVAQNASHIKQQEVLLLESEVVASSLKEFKSVQTAELAPGISARASDLLSSLTDGQYSELLLTPEWDIQYRFENGDIKEFPHLSVGERNTFALALRLALADMQASNIGLLVLDEVLDAMDEDRQNLTWLTLEGLLGRYEQIILITHVPAFKERAPFVIQL